MTLKESIAAHATQVCVKLCALPGTPKNKLGRSNHVLPAALKTTWCQLAEKV
jgi:hypothetical protein